jgi:hypothetical protein
MRTGLSPPSICNKGCTGLVGSICEEKGNEKGEGKGEESQ